MLQIETADKGQDGPVGKSRVVSIQGALKSLIWCEVFVIFVHEFVNVCLAGLQLRTRLNRTGDGASGHVLRAEAEFLQQGDREKELGFTPIAT